jgi:hypothetical protein
MECIGCHSSILEIRNQQMRGQIYIETGKIIHAAVGTLIGEKAFYRLLSLTGGEFQLKPFSAPPEHTVQGRWESLLMEAAHAFDEETALIPKNTVEGATKSSAPNPAPAQPPLSPAAPGEHAVIGDDIIEVAVYDGKWTPVDGSQK